MPKWGSALKKEWAALAQVATWLLTIVGGFVLPPAAGLTREDSDAWKKFGIFVLTIAVGLMFIATRKWRSKAFGRNWIIAALTLLVLAACSFVGYQWLSESRTCLYHRQKVVIGTQLTTHAFQHMQSDSGMSCADLIEDYVGKIDDVWTSASINQSHVFLGSGYVLALSVSALSVLAALQAIAIAKGSAQR